MLEVDTMDTDNSCVPLDLSLNSAARGKCTSSPEMSPLRDYCTDSDDSDGQSGRLSPGGKNCKAYKKSLMRRYHLFELIANYHKNACSMRRYTYWSSLSVGPNAYTEMVARYRMLVDRRLLSLSPGVIA
ncbi:hypothetical protein L9F63_002104, partial [Diploptera punctata]